MSVLKLGAVERDHLLMSWNAGVMTAEACRAWLSAPAASLLDEEEAQNSYKEGVDHQGTRLSEETVGWAAFLTKANLGHFAISQKPDSSYIVVRHPKYSTWVALLQDWESGLTVYSRWAAEGTINYSMSPPQDAYITLISHAQRRSAQRPSKPRPNELNPTGADFIDPLNPVIGTRSGEQSLQPDLIDRFWAWLRDFL